VRLLGGLKGVIDPGWSAHRFPPYRVRDRDLVVAGDRDDEVLRRFGIAGTVVALPGHTVDSIGIVLDSGDAFVGDAAANFLRFAGTKHCVVFITDLGEYYASWRRLIDAGAKRIHPAHGESFPVEHLVRDLGANRKADLVPYER
jgi:glyoxylase-like metal-dependent hydrolase (beta-lactamase superfamily II)